MNITTAWLATADGVCNRPLMAEHIEIFRREWGDEVEVTRDTLLRAAELGLNLPWLARQLTFWPGQGADHAEMRAAIDPIHAERARAVAAARAGSGSDEELDAIHARYCAAAAPHLARYREAGDAHRGPALAEALEYQAVLQARKVDALADAMGLQRDGIDRPGEAAQNV